jgi:hypothetical protein
MSSWYLVKHRTNLLLSYYLILIYNANYLRRIVVTIEASGSLLCSLYKVNEKAYSGKVVSGCLSINSDASSYEFECNLVLRVYTKTVGRI